ncbi:carbonic anhydrase [Streptomyces sp. Marseille-Q5077]|uniref:carbonic anhydrase n=1 Tax=Streptomyces sp. Marseille-Q5077 TaxID=3418995 RepID=UPI003D064FBC
MRQSLTSGQQPFALVLGCIDSRVPPELVFDQGLGDLMTVRSARRGPRRGRTRQRRLRRARTEHPPGRGPRPPVVRRREGRRRVGPVRRAAAAHIQYIADRIAPNIDRTQEGDARIDSTIDANIRAIRTHLAAEPDLAAKVTSGQLAIVGARYELTTQRLHRVG